MTLSNYERMIRCQEAVAAYSDDDVYTNLVDFLADAMHWCHANGHAFRDALETAGMHFDAEWNEEAPFDDPIAPEVSNGRNPSMPRSNPVQHDASERLLRSVIDDALEAFWQVIVRCYPQAETGDLSPLTTVHLEQAAAVAVAEWVWANIPATSNEE